MNVAKTMREAFEATGLSLTEFAKRVGVRVETAHGWINGNHGVRLSRLPRIAKILKTTVAKLVA